MNVRLLGHTGLTIADRERSLAFDVGIPGLEVVSRRSVDAPWRAQLPGVDTIVECFEAPAPPS